LKNRVNVGLRISDDSSDYLTQRLLQLESFLDKLGGEWGWEKRKRHVNVNWVLHICRLLEHEANRGAELDCIFLDDLLKWLRFLHLHNYFIIYF
jgi:hypothetical protein